MSRMNQSPQKILKKTTMKEQVYELIKGRILDQTYALGEKINMLELTQELGISNSPVREALSLLESEKLVVFEPNAGPRVISIDNKVFAEVQEASRIFLIGAYEQCVHQNLLPQLIDRMEAYITLQKQVPTERTYENNYQFAQLAIEFDFSVIKIFHNQTLENLYAAFFNLLYLMVIFDHQHIDTDRAKNIEEHESILNAIKLGDHDAVKKNINKHFCRTINFESMGKNVDKKFEKLSRE